MPNSPATKSGLSSDFYNIIFVFIILISLTLRFYHSSFSGIIVDELVDTQLAYQVANGFPLYNPDFFWERTPLMTYLVGYISNDTHSALIFTKARHFMWMIGTLLFFMVGYGGFKLYGRRYLLVSPVLLLTFSTFMDRSFRVRADLMSTFFATPALIVLLSPQLKVLPIAFGGFSLGLAFMTSQKAVYFVIAFALALIARIVVHYENKLILKTILKFGFISGSCFMIPLIVQAAYMASQGSLNTFIENCFFGGYRAGILAQTYNHTIEYFYQSLKRSPHFWLLGLIGMARGLKQLYEQRKKTPANRVAITVWTLVMLLLISQHTVKFPYLFLTLSPCLALMGALPVVQVMKYLETKKPFRFAALVPALTIIAVIVLLIIPHRRNFEKTKRTLHAMDLMTRVEAITDPSDHVWDGMGLVLTRKRALPYSLTKRWVDERKSGMDYPVMEHLKKNQPVVAIANNRLKRLTDEEEALLETHFIKDFSRIHVVGQIIEHVGGEATYPLSLLATTDYAILTNNYETQVKLGKELLGRTNHFEAGTYQVTISGPPGKVTFKYNRAIRTKPHKVDTYKDSSKFLINYRR